MYKIFELVEHLHKGRIILGDINPKNILFNPQQKCPVIVGLDSAQVDLHPTTAMSVANLDPTLERQRKAAGGKIYLSTSSDIFGIACLTFRIIVGVSPFKLVLSPPMRAEELRPTGVSITRNCQPVPRQYRLSPPLPSLASPRTKAEAVVFHTYNCLRSWRRNSVLMCRETRKQKSSKALQKLGFVGVLAEKWQVQNPLGKSGS